MPAPKARAMKTSTSENQNITNLREKTKKTVTVKETTTVQDKKRKINTRILKTTTSIHETNPEKYDPSYISMDDPEMADPIYEANRKKALEEEAAQLKELKKMKRAGKYTCLLCKVDVPKSDMEVNSAHYPICINCKG